MPIYEYQCLKENHRFEVVQKMSEDPISTCPTCGGSVKKLISATAFQLKGSGWYKDGYASSGSVNTADKSTPASTATETKSETKTETLKKE